MLMSPQIAVGDWVQAVEEITEPIDLDHPGAGTILHASPGAVGHVISIPAPDVYDVFWERAGTITICHSEEVVRLCGPDDFRSQIMNRKVNR